MAFFLIMPPVWPPLSLMSDFLVTWTGFPVDMIMMMMVYVLVCG